MITHNEVMAVWHGTEIVASLAAGLLIAHWRWPSRERLDKEWDHGHGEGRDEGYWAGYSIGVDDERRGLAWLYDEYGENLPSDFKNPVVGTCDWGDCDDEAVGRRLDDEHGWLPVCVAHLADEDQVRPAGPSPAAGRTEPAFVDEWGNWVQGRTYSELVMLAAQDTPGPLDDALTAPVDPGWFPEALRRSEAWLAECRAELGL